MIKNNEINNYQTFYKIEIIIKTRTEVMNIYFFV